MSTLKRGARDALAPLARPLTSRFAQLQERADHTEALATTAVQKTEELQAGLWDVARRLDEIGGHLALLFEQLNVDLQVMGEYGRITERLGNRLEINAGALARDAAELRDLVLCGAGPERILGEPFALQQLADLDAGSRILTVGVNASTLPLSLASNGYLVTALDEAPVSFTHPNLESVGAPIEQWDGPRAPLHAVVCLTRSAVGADAVRRFAFWLQPAGRLVLGSHLGAADAGGPDELPDGWTAVARRTYREPDRGAWEEVAPDAAARWPHADRGYTVVVARPG